MKIKENGKVRIQCDVKPETYRKLKMLSYCEFIGEVIDNAVSEYFAGHAVPWMIDEVEKYTS